MYRDMTSGNLPQKRSVWGALIEFNARIYDQQRAVFNQIDPDVESDEQDRYKLNFCNNLYYSRSCVKWFVCN